jgi:serine/threonine-protein kinase
LFGVTSLALAALLIRGSSQSVAETPLRLSVEAADQPFYLSIGSSVELSPDGTRLAYVVGTDASRKLYVRRLDQLEGTELVSGIGAGAAPYHPFFSPDGKWIGYVTANELRKVPSSGGASQTLTKVDRSRGATWTPDDQIIIATGAETGLLRVPAAGGDPQPLTTLESAKQERTHRWPQVLPGGKAVLFTAHTKPSADFGQARVEALVLATGERKVIQPGASYARYVPSGHLLFVNKGTLFAVPFDPDALEVRGTAAPVVQDVSWTAAHGGAQFSVSETGRLVYVHGAESVPDYPVVWIDREGSISPLWDQRGSYANPRLSPDGSKLSLTVFRDGNWDVWIYDIERGVPTRMTFDAAAESEQIWSPDGRYIVYSSDQQGGDDLYRKQADGSGEVERLTSGTTSSWATSWSPDGRYLAYISSEGSFDLYVLPLTGDRKPQKFLGTPFAEADPAFSPDGRWIAYDSNESGRPEVYVRPFPARGGKWQVSDGGGAYPKWSRDGRQLFFRSNAGIMVTDVETAGETFRAARPRAAVTGPFRGGLEGLSLGGNSFADYDVSPDGRRFVVFPAAASESREERPHVTLVTGWFDELRQRFGGR